MVGLRNNFGRVLDTMASDYSCPSPLSCALVLVVQVYNPASNDLVCLAHRPQFTVNILIPSISPLGCSIVTIRETQLQQCAVGVAPHWYPAKLLI